MAQLLPTAIMGRTGLEVTRLGYGTAHRRSMTDKQSETIHNAVLDAGINFIDTSDDYGNAEELIGKYIAHRRSEFYLATKCGSSKSGSGHDWTVENVMRNLEQSLQLLKTDYVDVMQLHNPTVKECQQGDLVKALEEMRRMGKVRWIGISTTLPHLPSFLEWNVFDAMQIPYSALERIHENWITVATEKAVGIILRGGVAKGDPETGTGVSNVWQNFDNASLNELRAEGESRSAFILRFTLTHPDIHTIITGTTNPDHLAENIQAVLDGPLSKDTYAELKRRMDAVGERPAQIQ